MSEIHLLSYRETTHKYLEYYQAANEYLQDVTLEGVFMKFSNLRNATLVEVNLRGANLREADLEGADLDNTEFDEYTVLPDGTNWGSNTDMTRFTDRNHPDFWRSDRPHSPASRTSGKD